MIITGDIVKNESFNFFITLKKFDVIPCVLSNVQRTTFSTDATFKQNVSFMSEIAISTSKSYCQYTKTPCKVA